MVLAQKHGAQSFFADMQDVSQGGLSFASTPNKAPLEKGDRVYMEILAMDISDIPIPVLGTIRRAELGHGNNGKQEQSENYGVVFDELSPAQSSQIGRLVNYINQQNNVDPA